MSKINSSTSAKIAVVIVALGFLLFAAFVLNNTRSSGNKPSKQAVVDAYLSLTSGNNPNEAQQKYFECIVDNIYDDFSADTLNAIVNTKSGDDLSGSGITSSEQDVLENAGAKCAHLLDDSDNSGNSNDDSGTASKKSDAKTTLVAAAIAVRSLQTGNGTTDFSGINADALHESDPDIVFIEQALSSGDDAGTVALVQMASEYIVLQSRSDEDGVCYFIRLSSDSSSQYAYSQVGDGACDTEPNADSGSDFVDSQDEGWRSRLSNFSVFRSYTQKNIIALAEDMSELHVCGNLRL